MFNDCNIPTRGRSTTKKALLIGIGYHSGAGRDGQTLDFIPTSIPKVRAFEEFLREFQGYTDITVMTDEDGVRERYQPTKSNLKREIRALRLGVEPGDRRVFYFAGHSDQMPSETNPEDGQDEVLVALNGLRIRDNTLHRLLVKDLPKGSALTAIFDSCSPGKLLDLDHYHCNDVYRPWVNKGDHGSNTLRNYVVPRHSLLQPVMEEQFATKGLLRSAWSLESLDKNIGQRTSSPERQFPCDGWCRETQALIVPDHADVISISSSDDGQVSWDASTSNGGSVSMTTYLIDILKEHPEISTSELMTRLAHAVHSFTTRMHGRVREERRARRTGEGRADSEDTELEENKDNFRDLQLGSITPLDMNRPFVL